MYPAFEKELDTFLAGEYLKTPRIHVPNATLTGLILRGIRKDILRDVAKRSYAVMATLREQLQLGEDGRAFLATWRTKDILQLLPVRELLPHIAQWGVFGTDIAEIEKGLADALVTGFVRVDGRKLRTGRWLRKALQPFESQLSGRLPVLLSAVFNQVSEATRPVLVTTNILDFLLSAQEGACGFGSCHSLDGDHSHGNVSAALTPFVALSCLLDPEVKAYPFYKLGRMWTYIPTNKQLILGRRYGTFGLPRANNVREQLSARLSPETPPSAWHEYPGFLFRRGDVSGAGNLKWDDVDDHDHDCAEEGCFCEDPLITSSALPVYIDVEPTSYFHVFEGGARPAFHLEFQRASCLACGTEMSFQVSDGENLRCHVCGPVDTQVCFVCDRNIGRYGDVYFIPEVGEGTVCPRCHRANTIVCEGCGEYVYIHSPQLVTDERAHVRYCGDCANAREVAACTTCGMSHAWAPCVDAQTETRVEVMTMVADDLLRYRSERQRLAQMIWEDFPR